jgi:ABC-type branched-subunit amino acid transport system ATPase component
MLDEPAAGLSPSERVILTQLIKNLPGDVTLIVIEHDMEVVLDIAEQIHRTSSGSGFSRRNSGRNYKITKSRTCIWEFPYA